MSYLDIIICPNVLHLNFPVEGEIVVLGLDQSNLCKVVKILPSRDGNVRDVEVLATLVKGLVKKICSSSPPPFSPFFFWAGMWRNSPPNIRARECLD